MEGIPLHHSASSFLLEILPMPSSEDKAPENFDRASHMRKVAHTPTPQKNRRRLTKERKKQRGDFFRSLVRPGWQGRLRHFCWVWLLLLVMSAMVDKVVEVPGMTSKERQEKIAGVNQPTTAALNQMGGGLCHRAILQTPRTVAWAGVRSVGRPFQCPSRRRKSENERKKTQETYC